MPVLRSPPDNTLAETLGNLGSTLAEGLNPMNQIRANNMASEIQQRNWELQQKQSMDAANKNAANVFYNSDIAQTLDPATREMTAAGLRNGTLSVNNYIDALTKTGSLKANQAAADMYRQTHLNLSPADRESNAAQILRGDKTAAELDAQESTTGLTIRKNTATIGGADAARAAADAQANAAPGAAALTESEAYSDPAKAAELLARGRVRATTGPLTPAQTDTAQADIQSAGFPRVPLGTAVTVAGQPAADADAAARAAEADRQKGVAKAITEGIPQTGNIFPGGPLPGQPGNEIGKPFNPTPPAAFPPSPLDGAPVAAPPPRPDVTIPNTESPSSLPLPITRQTPAGTIVGETSTEAAQRTSIDTATRAQLQEAIDGGVAGLKMKTLLDRLNTLADILDTRPGMAQIPVAIANWLAEKGIVATDTASIRKEMQSLFKAQIPELRKDMGVKFEAGPELSAQGQMIGDPNIPGQALKGIFARQMAIANLGIQRRELAMRALYPGQAQPLSRADYLKEDAKVYDNLGAEMAQQLKDAGAYGSNPPPAPPDLFTIDPVTHQRIPLVTPPPR